MKINVKKMNAANDPSLFRVEKWLRESVSDNAAITMASAQFYACKALHRNACIITRWIVGKETRPMELDPRLFVADLLVPGRTIIEIESVKSFRAGKESVLHDCRLISCID